MPKRIAIVEDEAELASLIDYNLTRHGYQTQILRGDKGTLEELERAKPDLIVLDVMLPDVDGFQLCREIRQSQAMARTPEASACAVLLPGAAQRSRNVRPGARRSSGTIDCDPMS